MTGNGSSVGEFLSPFNFPGYPFTRSADERSSFHDPGPECVRSCRGCLSKGSRYGERRTRRPRAPRATTRGVETGSGLSRTGVAVATAICFNPRSIIGLPRHSKAVYYSGSLHPLLHTASSSASESNQGSKAAAGLNLCVVFVPPMSSQPTRENAIGYATAHS